MERTPTQTILLIIASGIGGILLFIAVLIGVAFSFFERTTTTGTGPPFARSGTTVSSPPPVSEDSRFHGTQGRWSSAFSRDRNKTLDAGSAELVGNVRVDGKPLYGLRVRLALNGSVMSQWATSGQDGRYAVPVPPGKYRVDGYELDSSIAHKLLKGKTDAPYSFEDGRVIAVSEGESGSAPDLEYVDPVRKTGPFGEVSAEKPVVITWEPYSGAMSYRVQLVEQEDPKSYDQRDCFEWNQRPVVATTSLSLQEHGISLNKGRYYTATIHALDSKNRQISESLRSYGKADFSVTN